MPAISVIIPIYNSENYLVECLESVLNQTFKDFEIICIDDGSTDSSSEILERFASADPRMRVIHQPNSGAALARNAGLSVATGDYLSILDSDDIFDEDMLNSAYENVRVNDSDICIFRVRLMDNNTKKITSGAWALVDSMMPNLVCFSGEEASRYIFQFCNGWTWDKLFKKSFINENKLEFQDIRVFNDSFFVYSAMASARKISICNRVLATKRRGLKNQISSNRDKNWPDFELLVSKLKDWLVSQRLWEFMEISFVNYAFHLPIVIMDTTPIKSKKLVFKYCKQTYLDKYDFYKYDIETFYRPNEYWRIQNIHEMDWKEYKIWARFGYRWGGPAITSITGKLNNIKRDKRIIISLTSYPARINDVSKVIVSILNQTVKPDKIVLYLSKLQFPRLKDELPKALRRMADGSLTINWTDDDLRSHKKYYYAFKEYPEDIIITVDDDEVYPKDLIHTLMSCHERFPNAVCAMRVHRIKFDEYGCILPYNDWIKEDETALLSPSMDVIPTGVSGVLYPPHCVDDRIFNKEMIKNLCPNADDLWLKTMSSLRGSPSVLAAPIGKQNPIPKSQDDALWSSNCMGGMNDVQMRNILDVYGGPKCSIRTIIDVFRSKEEGDMLKTSIVFTNQEMSLTELNGVDKDNIEIFIRSELEKVLNEKYHVHFISGFSTSDFINKCIGAACGEYIAFIEKNDYGILNNITNIIEEMDSEKADYTLLSSGINKEVSCLIIRRCCLFGKGIYLLPCYNPLCVLASAALKLNIKESLALHKYGESLHRDDPPVSLFGGLLVHPNIRNLNDSPLSLCPVCLTRAIFENTKKRKGVKCPNCGSLIKDRAFWLLLNNKVYNSIKQNMDILWISPNGKEEESMRSVNNVVLQTVSIRRLNRILSSRVCPWSDSSLDLILMKDCMQQIDDVDLLLNCLTKALKSDGHLLIYEDNVIAGYINSNKIENKKTIVDSLSSHGFSTDLIYVHRFCPRDLITECVLWSDMIILDCVPIRNKLN